MDISRHRLSMSWAVAGVVAPLVLYGIASALQTRLPQASLALGLAAAGAFPFWGLAWWPAMAHPANAPLFYAVAVGAFILNSVMFGLVGLLHQRIALWRTREKLPVLTLSLAVVLAVASFVAYGDW